MQLADMTHYVSTRLHEMVEVKAQLASHISACEAIVGALGSDFEALQLTEKSILDCARKKECLEYIEKNIGIRNSLKSYLFVTLCGSARKTDKEI